MDCRSASNGGMIYRCWWRVWWHGAYSIILTKAAMFHHDFLQMYTSVMSQEIRDYIDKRRNCEDIAMQFLISNSTHLPPVYVRGNLGDRGAIGGISTSSNVLKASHMDARSECLNGLIRMYAGKNPLVNSHVIVHSAANGWTNMPSTWLEFISSDLWNFI